MINNYKIVLKLWVIILPLFLLFNSCSTDFDVNAPYDDIPVVYGLLSHGETTHIIMINKTFLGSDNALVSAQIADSSIYSNLSGTVEEWVNGIYNRTFTLMDTIIPNKEAGVFYNTNNHAYYFVAGDLNEYAEYRLKISINEGAKTASASTLLVKDFSVNYLTENPLFSIAMANGTTASTGYYPDYNIKWISGQESKRYEVSMYYTYFDVTATDTVRRDNVWLLGDVLTSNLTGGEALSKVVNGQSFYQMVAARVASNDADNPAPGGAILKRIIGNISFKFTVAGDDLNTYMEVNAPITGIVEEKPQFTNIEGGLGLFSSRFQKIVSNKKLDLNSVREMCQGVYTGPLNFCVDTPTTVWSTIATCHCN